MLGEDLPFISHFVAKVYLEFLSLLKTNSYSPSNIKIALSSPVKFYEVALRVFVQLP